METETNNIILNRTYSYISPDAYWREIKVLYVFERGLQLGGLAMESLGR